MILGKTTLIVDTDCNSITPEINIESLYFEKLTSNGDSQYTVSKESVALTSPIQVFAHDNNDINKLRYATGSPSDISYGTMGWDSSFWTNSINASTTYEYYGMTKSTTRNNFIKIWGKNNHVFQYYKNNDILLFQLAEKDHEEENYTFPIGTLKDLEILRYYNFSDIMEVFTTYHQLHNNILLPYKDTVDTKLAVQKAYIDTTSASFNKGVTVIQSSVDCSIKPQINNLNSLLNTKSISTTWVSFLQAFNNKNLKPGIAYVISDYRSYNINLQKYYNLDTYELALVATDRDSISPHAYAISSNDDKGYWKNTDFSKWEIEVSIANTDDASIGEIIYLKDEFGNEAPYDFKSRIQYDYNLGGSGYLYYGIDDSNNRYDMSITGNITDCVVKSKSTNIATLFNDTTAKLKNLYIGYNCNNIKVMLTISTTNSTIYIGNNNDNILLLNAISNLYIGNNNTNINYLAGAVNTIGDNNTNITIYGLYNHIGKYCSNINISGTSLYNNINNNVKNISLTGSSYCSIDSSVDGANHLISNSNYMSIGQNNEITGNIISCSDITVCNGSSNISTVTNHTLYYDGTVIAPNYYADNDFTFTAFVCTNPEFTTGPTKVSRSTIGNIDSNITLTTNDTYGTWDSSYNAYVFPIAGTISGYKIYYSLNKNIDTNISGVSLSVYTTTVPAMSFDIQSVSANYIVINTSGTNTKNTLATLADMTEQSWVLKLSYNMNSIPFIKEVPIKVVNN